MASVSQLGYLGLSVSDVDAWERFATELLGLQSKGRDADGSLRLRMDEYDHRVIVHPTGRDDVDYVGWEVSDEQTLDLMTDQLKAAGVRVTSGTPAEADARRVLGLVKFEDPNGIRSELAYGPLQRFEDGFKSPRTISGFEAGTLGLGHIVITVDDLSNSLQFYRDVLGMRLTDVIRLETATRGRVTVAFLRCNSRHHSVALVPIPAAKRLQHVMLQLKSLDDVGATYYLCQERRALTSSLRRHTNDHMLSFYVESPSGFEVEYGWGGRLVDDRTWRVQYHETAIIWGQPRKEHRHTTGPTV